MSGLIERIQQRTGTAGTRPRVLDLTDETADDVLDALSSGTRRRAYRLLFEEPRTPSELAKLLETSVQNVQYHLAHLEDAELIEPVDSVYSVKGNEMVVYAPAGDPLVFFGDDDRFSRFRRENGDVAIGLGLLAASSLLVQWGATRLVGDDPATGGAVVPASYETTGSTVLDAITWFVFSVAEPGLVFFVCGLLVAALASLLYGRSGSATD